MLLELIAFAAGQGMAPAPTSPRPMFDVGDFPSWAINTNASAGAFLRFVQDPAGKIIDCKPLQTIGNPKLAREFCPILLRKKLPVRKNADPAGLFQMNELYFTMFIPDTPEGHLVSSSKLELEPSARIGLSSLPDGMKREVVQIVLTYDPAGRVTACKPLPLASRKPSELNAIACSQRAIFDGAPYATPAGVAVPYTVIRKVLFEAQ